jgi:hypothetical protein
MYNHAQLWVSNSYDLSFTASEKTVHMDTTELFIVIGKSMMTADAEPFKRYTSTIITTH